MKTFTENREDGSSKDKTAEMELRILTQIKEALEDGKPVRSIDFNEDDQKWVNQAQLLTSKKMLYIANVGEDEIEIKIMIK